MMFANTECNTRQGKRIQGDQENSLSRKSVMKKKALRECPKAFMRFRIQSLSVLL